MIDHGVGRLTDPGLRPTLTRLGSRSGAEHCHPHAFRRTFAHSSLRAGMSIFHFLRLIGRSDVAILRQYLALIGKDLEAAHMQFGAVDRISACPERGHAVRMGLRCR